MNTHKTIGVAKPAEIKKWLSSVRELLSLENNFTLKITCSEKSKLEKTVPNDSIT